MVKGLRIQHATCPFYRYAALEGQIKGSEKSCNHIVITSLKPRG